MTKGILERLAEGPVLGDGGYLLELEKRGYVQAGPFTPEVVIEHPHALAQLHREFLRAGVDVLQTMTFYASDDKLATVGLAGKVDEINRAAVKIAREVAAERDALVAGNLSLTWAYLPEDPSSPDHVRALFDRQLETQVDAGPPDFWVGETFSYLGEALLFVERAKRAGLPVMVTMSFEQPVPRSYEGDTPAECAKRLRDAGADVVGVNCLNGPGQQLPIAIEMRGAVDGPVAAQPVAYRTTADHPDFTSTPSFPYELDPIQLSRQEMAEFARSAREAGIDYVGSCCGSVQAHVRAMAKALDKVPTEERDWRSDTGRAMSAYEYYSHTESEGA
ncbi:MAG TPA: homocysteine S-methyltransferase family protein [Actinomycetota bacterium]